MFVFRAVDAAFRARGGLAAVCFNACCAACWMRFWGIGILYLFKKLTRSVAGIRRV